VGASAMFLVSLISIVFSLSLLFNIKRLNQVFNR
jgi:hypothetical protein